MAEAAAEVLALQDLKARMLEKVARIDARIEDLEANGIPLEGTGDEDEPHRMKREAREAAQAAQAPETATKEPVAERAVKPAARKKASR